MSTCHSCGKEMSAGTRLCQFCGTQAAAGAAHPAVCAESSAATVALPATSGTVSSEAMATNIAGALAYLMGFITGGIFLLIDPYKNNSFIRFHALQSIFFNVAWFAFWIVWTIISTILTSLTRGVFTFIDLPLILIFSFVGFGLWAFLMYQAYQQKLFRLPVVGRFAAQYAGVKL